MSDDQTRYCGQCRLYEAEIERLREAVLERGGCRLLTLGDDCKCGLCIRDAEIERLQKERKRLLAAYLTAFDATYLEARRELNRGTTSE